MEVYLSNAMLAAVVSVGLTQIVKKWLPKDCKSSVYTVVFCVITFVYACISVYIPESVQQGFLALSIGTLGYDNILKMFEKIIERIAGVDSEK